jgi:hypothetical protein
MKSFLSKTLLAFVATAGLLIAATDASAHGHWRGRVGVYIGAPVVVSPWYSPYYGYGPYANPYYYPPVVREEPTVYIEQGTTPSVSPAPAPAPAPAPQAQAPAPQQQFWYYCQDSKTYYPHAQTCASPWQRVIPHAPPQPQ